MAKSKEEKVPGGGGCLIWVGTPYTKHPPGVRKKKPGHSGVTEDHQRMLKAPKIWESLPIYRPVCPRGEGDDMCGMGDHIFVNDQHPSHPASSMVYWREQLKIREGATSQTEWFEISRTHGALKRSGGDLVRLTLNNNSRCRNKIRKRLGQFEI